MTATKLDVSEQFWGNRRSQRCQWAMPRVPSQCYCRLGSLLFLEFEFQAVHQWSSNLWAPEQSRWNRRFSLDNVSSIYQRKVCRLLDCRSLVLSSLVGILERSSRWRGSRNCPSLKCRQVRVYWDQSTLIVWDSVDCDTKKEFLRVFKGNKSV